MADTINRSMTHELAQGMVDGSRKQPNPNRGGIEEDTTNEARKELAHDLYDVTTDTVLPNTTALPDGTSFRNR